MKKLFDNILLSPNRTLTAIICLAILIRIVFFLQIFNSPCAFQHRWKATDMNFFNLWAEQIASGDWLSERVKPPYRSWQRNISKQIFEAKGIPFDDRDPSAGRSLWDAWYGEKQFFQEPLYAYFVAVLYKVFFRDVRIIFLFQMMLGIVNVFLVYHITYSLFDIRAARIAAILATLYSPMIFYEAILLRATLICFMQLWIVYAVITSIKKDTLFYWFLTGFLFGLSLLLKSIFSFLGLGTFFLLVYLYYKKPGRLFNILAVMGLGASLCLILVFGRNVAVGAKPFVISGANAYVFLTTNTSDYSPDDGFVISQHSARIMMQTDGKTIPIIIETLKTHPSLWSYLRLIWGKFSSLWHWYEKPNNANFYYYSKHAAILKLLPVTFLIVAPFGIVGLFLGISYLRKGAILYALILSNILVMLLSCVVSRFRTPFAVALLPFCGLTVVWLIEQLQLKNIKHIIIVLSMLICISSWTMRPLNKEKSLIRVADYIAPYSYYYKPLIDKAVSMNQLEKAASVWKAFIQTKPKFIDQYRKRPPIKKEAKQLVRAFAFAHLEYAKALRTIARASEADRQERIGTELMR